MKSPTVDPRMEARLQNAEQRFVELDAELVTPEVLGSPDRLRELGQERARLDAIVGTGRRLYAAIEEHNGAAELL